MSLVFGPGDQPEPIFFEIGERAIRVMLDGGDRPRAIMTTGPEWSLDAGERGQPLLVNDATLKLSEGPGWQLVGPPEGDGGVINFGPPAGWGSKLTEQINGNESILH